MELPAPTLSWKDGTPVADDYDDPYYSVADGLAESRYVFLQGNQLEQRLKETHRFVIGETGFGSGLNFLALWQLWESLPEPRPRMHFISTEKFPFTPEMIREAHASWPELKPYSEALINALPPAIAGAHRRWFADGRITLDLLYGDATDMLEKLDATIQIDAWFLDGFAPTKNPDMWSTKLYNAMAKLSHSETTLATFTAAGDVRRGLADAGFAIEKTKGFGTKRDMVIGRWNNKERVQKNAPLVREALSPIAKASRPKQRETIIIGAGIAGCLNAWRLAQLGHRVALIDKADQICSAASGNPAAAFTPFYPVEWNTRGRVLASGFWTMHHLIHLLRDKGHTIRGDFCGTLMLDLRDGSKRAQRLADWQNAVQLPETIRQTVTAEQASEIVGVNMQYGGWFYPDGGWFHMGDIAQALLQDAGDAITLRLGEEVTSLEPYRDSEVIIANAHEAAKLLPELKLQKVHGQSIAFTPDAPWQSLHCVVHAGHALIPIGNGQLQFGATFRHHMESSGVVEEDSETLVSDLNSAFPDITVEAIEPWAGLRCTHGSRLPLIGHHKENIHLHLAHGARGLLSGCVEFNPKMFS